MKKYKAYIFDLYGTLVDIRTDENNPKLWQQLARFYSYNGANYSADEGAPAPRNEAEPRKHPVDVFAAE